jgi:hypothetical protein
MIYIVIGVAISTYILRIKGLIKALKNKDNSHLKMEIFLFVLTTIMFVGLSYFVLHMN